MRLIGKLYDLCSLYKTALFFNYHQVKEERIVKRDFYRHQRFQHIDRALKKHYRFCSPYTISKRFLTALGEEDIYTYGETDLSALYLIAQEAGLSSSDHLIELGSGRGRGVFFLSEFFGCQATGIEWNPYFVQKAQEVKQKFALDQVDFHCVNFSHVDLSAATLIYLYGTCLPDEVITQLIDQFSSLKKGTKIITVSYSLLDYDCPDYTIKKEFSVRYPWGMADVYLHEKK